MSLPSKRLDYRVRKTLNRWDGAYRYEAYQGKQKLQLYSIFFKEKIDMHSLSKAIENIQGLNADCYLNIKGLRGFDKSQAFEKYNLQILTEFTKMALKNHIFRIQEWSIKLSNREIALVLKAFVQLLHDLVSTRDNKPFLQYLKVIWNCELFDAFYVNDNFQFKINLLPNFSKMNVIEWKSLSSDFEEHESEIIIKIIRNFFSQLCLAIPTKDSDLNILTDIINNDNRSNYFDTSFQLPGNLLKIIFDLLNVNYNCIQTIKELHRLTVYEGYSRHIHSKPLLKYNYDAKYSKNNIIIKNDSDFYSFIYNIGLDTLVSQECPEMFRDPRTNINPEAIESLTIDLDHLRPQFFNEMNTKEFPSLKKFKLEVYGISLDTLKVLLKWKGISNLETLSLVDKGESSHIMGTMSCHPLSRCVQLSNLKELSLISCQIDDLAIGYLCEGSCLKNLEKLDLSFNEGITEVGYKLLNQSADLRNLQCLKLMNNFMQDKSLKALIQTSIYPKMYKELYLTRCRLSGASIVEIVNSRLVDSLEVLYLDYNILSSIYTVLKGPVEKMSTLKKLSVRECSLNDTGLDSLLSISVPENLVYLDVSYNINVSINLVNSYRMRGLKELVVEESGVDARFFDSLLYKGEQHRLEKLKMTKAAHYSGIFESLVKRRILKNLNKIVATKTSHYQVNSFFTYYPLVELASSLEILRLCGLTADKVSLRDTFTHSLYLINLKELKLQSLKNGNQILLQLSQNSGSLSQLKVLEMPFCEIKDKTLYVMCKSGRFESLKRLNLCGHRLNYKMMRKFLCSKLGFQLKYLDLSQGKIRMIKWTKRMKAFKKKYMSSMELKI